MSDDFESPSKKAPPWSDWDGSSSVGARGRLRGPPPARTGTVEKNLPKSTESCIFWFDTREWPLKPKR